jgi:hypothetical protein
MRSVLFASRPLKSPTIEAAASGCFVESAAASLATTK